MSEQAPAAAANKKQLTAADLNDGQTLRDDAYVSIAEIEGTKKKYYSHGYGTTNRFDGDTGYAYADLQVDDGSGTIVNASGTLRLVAYHSTDMEIPKAIMDEYDLDDLRASEAEARSDRLIVPFQTTAGVAEDEVLAFEVKVESANDGHTVSAADCSFHIPYSEFRKTA